MLCAMRSCGASCRVERGAIFGDLCRAEPTFASRAVCFSLALSTWRELRAAENFGDGWTSRHHDVVVVVAAIVFL